jgi:hypothetical protein
MRTPPDELDPAPTTPDWSNLDAYGDHEQRFRRFTQRTRGPPSLRRLPKTPRWTISTLFHFVLILAVGALALLIIVAGMPRERQWAGPKPQPSEAGTAARGWLTR